MYQKNNMIKGFLWTLILVSTNIIVMAQSEAIPYQSILTDGDNSVLRNLSTEIEVNIIQDTESGNIIYSESHQVVTGQQGEIILEIGNGEASLFTFQDIDWTKPNFVSIGFKPEGFTSFLYNDTVELLSVPYALFALKVTCQQGCPGPKGEDGDDGVDGENGVDGADGWDGQTGQQGETGYSGIEGITSAQNSAPTNPLNGEFYIDDGTNRADGQPGFRYYTGVNWIDL